MMKLFLSLVRLKMKLEQFQIENAKLTIFETFCKFIYIYIIY